MKEELHTLSQYVFDRTRRRLETLSDDEYFWAPVPVTWSVHVAPEGIVAVDFDPGLQQGPFTTIAWRLWHLVHCYGDARNQLWLMGTDDGGAESRCLARPTAMAALKALEAANGWWQELLEMLTEAQLAEPLGAIAGPYSASSKASYVLHQIDEQIHHGAEIGVLRDLYAAMSSTP